MHGAQDQQRRSSSVLSTAAAIAILFSPYVAFAAEPSLDLERNDPAASFLVPRAAQILTLRSYARKSD